MILNIPANNSNQFIICIPNNLKWSAATVDFVSCNIEITQFFWRVWFDLSARGNQSTVSEYAAIQLLN